MIYRYIGFIEDIYLKSIVLLGSEKIVAIKYSFSLSFLSADKLISSFFLSFLYLFSRRSLRYLGISSG